MSDINPTEKFRINLNQNLWGLIVALTGLGLGEYYSLCTLFIISLIVSIGASISFLFTLVAYTINYWKNKMRKS
jgi:hypothetical protein